MTVAGSCRAAAAVAVSKATEQLRKRSPRTRLDESIASKKPKREQKDDRKTGKEKTADNAASRKKRTEANRDCEIRKKHRIDAPTPSAFTKDNPVGHSTSSSDEDEVLINRNPRNAVQGDVVDIYWSEPDEHRGWWKAKVQKKAAKDQCVVLYDNYTHPYRHALTIETHYNRSVAKPVPQHLAWRFAAPAPAPKVTGCELFPLHRLLVVRERFWHDFRRLRKHVEFRPEDSLTTIAPGMFVLLCPPLAVRRKKPIGLLQAEVEEVVILTLHDACTRFPVESSDCELAILSATWKRRNIRCVIFKGVRQAKDFACLAPGNQGCLHQFSQGKGTPQFCARKDVGNMVTLHIVRHGTVDEVTLRLINPDNSLTDAGDCLSNACSRPECPGKGSCSSSQVAANLLAQLLYFHIFTYFCFSCFQKVLCMIFTFIIKFHMPSWF